MNFNSGAVSSEIDFVNNKNDNRWHFTADTTLNKTDGSFSATNITTHSSTSHVENIQGTVKGQFIGKNISGAPQGVTGTFDVTGTKNEEVLLNYESKGSYGGTLQETEQGARQ